MPPRKTTPTPGGEAAAEVPGVAGRATPTHTRATPNAFLWGAGGLAVGLIFAVVFPNPTGFQAAIVAAIVSLAGAGIADGMLEVNLQIQTRWVRGGGAFAVFLLLFVGILKVAVPDALSGLGTLAGPSTVQGTYGSGRK
jgi:hypothetical protein